jgi:glycosyltransferase involved in cell wall biosynthesis
MRSNRPRAGDADPDRRCRIVHVTFGMDVGGQEKLLVEFARYADPGRFDLRFISLGSRGVLADDIEALGWPVTALGVPNGLRLSLIVRLGLAFRRWRPDVLHTHDDRALFYAGPAARATRVPRVVNTRHGRNCHFTSRQVAVGRQLARLVDRYVCVSDDAKAQCIAEGIASSRLRTIKNGIDVDRFPFSGPDPSGPIVAVARLSPEKDLANLVRAVALAAWDEPGLRLEIAGDGPCLPELEELVAELGVDERITFLGEIRDVPALLARASLFVLPSRSEGIPLTLLEAMARGLPAVATRVGGIPEVVVDGETGLLVPSGDPVALAQAIRRIRHDPGRGLRMGQAGRQHVEQHFDIRRMVGDYEALYRESASSVPRLGHRRDGDGSVPGPAEFATTVE